MTMDKCKCGYRNEQCSAPDCDYANGLRDGVKQERERC